MVTSSGEGAAEIATEIDILLSGMGLPFADTADRAHAVGVLITPAGTAAATIEWFVSKSVRSAAAREQVEGRAEGQAALLHRTARAHLHGAVTGILRELGYTVTQTPAGLRVEGVAGRSEGAATAARL
ncbi:hypothetical protein, partial [Streptomyces wuyuanensis]|uniref:hypothetical protein n=1 Tax=Streptomyces wuyuanensis TaxID=1196353 RepID=UPI003D72ADB3